MDEDIPNLFLLNKNEAINILANKKKTIQNNLYFTGWFILLIIVSVSSLLLAILTLLLLPAILIEWVTRFIIKRNRKKHENYYTDYEE